MTPHIFPHASTFHICSTSHIDSQGMTQTAILLQLSQRWPAQGAGAPSDPLEWEATSVMAPQNAQTACSMSTSPPRSPPSPASVRQESTPIVSDGPSLLQRQLSMALSSRNGDPARLRVGLGQRPSGAHVDPDVLSRMVTASGQGVHGMPIRVASMQDFRRSTLSRHAAPELPRQPQPRMSAISSALPGNASPRRPMRSDNPLLKMMEQRMAAQATATSEVGADTLRTSSPSSASPSLAPSNDDSAALRASIDKWSGLASVVNGEAQDKRDTHKAAKQASPRSSVNSSQPTRVPLSQKQVELLQEMIGSQLSKEHGREHDETKVEQSVKPAALPHLPVGTVQPMLPQETDSLKNMTLQQLISHNNTLHQLIRPPHVQQGVQHTRGHAQPGLDRCAVSCAELDRLRQENRHIQQAREQAAQELFWHRQKTAASALLAMQNCGQPALPSLEQQQLELLHRMKGNTLVHSSAQSASLVHSIKPSKSSSSFRKRQAEEQDYDGSECSGASRSISSATSSNKMHRSLSYSSQQSCLSGSMTNLRLRSRPSMMSGGHAIGSMTNQSFSSRSRPSMMSGGHAIGSMRNQSFSSGLDTVQDTGSPKMPCLSSNPLSRPDVSRAPLSSSVSINHCPTSWFLERKSSSAASSDFHSLQTRVNKQNEVAPSPSTDLQTEEFRLTAEEPRCTSNENMTITTAAASMEHQKTDRDTNPMDVIMEALSSRGLKCETKPSMDMEDQYFTTTTEMYDQETVNAIRSNDMVNLRRLHSQEKNFQCGNRNGETLIHLACRRSSPEVVSFLVNEAGVSLFVRDDMGRTPWHDACWRKEPELELLDLLLEQAPALLLLRDKRGHAPLDYGRREHWGVLVPFLRQRTDKFKPVE